MANNKFTDKILVFLGVLEPIQFHIDLNQIIFDKPVNFLLGEECEIRYNGTIVISVFKRRKLYWDFI